MRRYVPKVGATIYTRKGIKVTVQEILDIDLEKQDVTVLAYDDEARQYELHAMEFGSLKDIREERNRKAVSSFNFLCNELERATSTLDRIENLIHEPVDFMAKHVRRAINEQQKLRDLIESETNPRGDL